MPGPTDFKIPAFLGIGSSHNEHRANNPRYNIRFSEQFNTVSCSSRAPQNLRTDSEYYFNAYPTAFPYGNGMVLHFYQQQESSTTKTVHKVINRGLKTYV